MELDAHVFGTPRLQEARGPIAVIGDLRVCRVMAHQNVMPGGKLHNLFEKRHVCYGSCGVVRIIDKHHFGSTNHVSGDGVKIRQKAFLPEKGHWATLTAGEDSRNIVDRITRARNQGHVARIDEGKRQVGYSLFAPDEGENFFFRVKVNAKPFLVPISRRSPELEHTRIGRIPVIDGICHGLFHGLDNVSRGGKVRIADAEVDEIHPFRPQFCLFPVDLLEQVWGKFAQTISFIEHGQSVSFRKCLICLKLESLMRQWNTGISE